MKTYSCLIIDDEPLAAEVIEDYVRQIPFLKHVATCSDALFALEILQKEKIELLFLDIHLPKLRGLDFLKSLKNPPYVILTTAHHEYALQSYEFGVIDYLLKPIEFSRFVSAVGKLPQDANTSVSLPIPDVPHIFIHTDKKKIRIDLHDILYIESIKEYIKIVTPAKTWVTKCAISKMEEELDRSSFIRIHRSFLVARNKIKAYSASEIEINGKTLPIGATYKEQVLSQL